MGFMAFEVRSYCLIQASPRAILYQQLDFTSRAIIPIRDQLQVIHTYTCFSNVHVQHAVTLQYLTTVRG